MFCCRAQAGDCKDQLGTPDLALNALTCCRLMSALEQVCPCAYRLPGDSMSWEPANSMLPSESPSRGCALQLPSGTGVAFHLLSFYFQVN